MKNLSWFLIPSLALVLSVAADNNVVAESNTVKASYDFNLNVKELEQAEARLKALESSLSGKIEESKNSKPKPAVVEKKLLTVVTPAPSTQNLKPVQKKEIKVEAKPVAKVAEMKPPVVKQETVKKEAPANSIADKVKSDITNLEQAISKKDQDLVSKDQEIASLKADFTKQLEETRASIQNQSAEELKTLQEKLASQSEQLNQLTVANQAYKTMEIELSQKFEKQIEKLNLKLVLAETEVERLSAILEDQNRKVLGLKPVAREKKTSPATSQKVVKAPEVEQNVDMPIVKVMVDKANLRTGPGMNHSPLMELAGGSRLVVEQKQGAWFRVIAPNGVRAWISADVTETVPNGFNEETTTVKVQGYDDTVEARALKLIKGDS